MSFDTHRRCVRQLSQHCWMVSTIDSFSIGRTSWEVVETTSRSAVCGSGFGLMDLYPLGRHSERKKSPSFQANSIPATTPTFGTTMQISIWAGPIAAVEGCLLAKRIKNFQAFPGPKPLRTTCNPALLPLSVIIWSKKKYRQRRVMDGGGLLCPPPPSPHQQLPILMSIKVLPIKKKGKLVGSGDAFDLSACELRTRKTHLISQLFMSYRQAVYRWYWYIKWGDTDTLNGVMKMRFHYPMIMYNHYYV